MFSLFINNQKPMRFAQRIERSVSTLGHVVLNVVSKCKGFTMISKGIRVPIRF